MTKDISYEEFEEILNASYDGIHITDEKGTTLFYNKACERIEGLNKEEVIGKNMKQLVNSGKYSTSVALEVLKTKKTTTLVQKVNGMDIMATGTPIIKNGEVIKIVINSRDITKMNELNREVTSLKQKNIWYKEEIKNLIKNIENHIVAKSDAMQNILRLCLKLGKVNSTTLILGESGTGKGLISKFLHENSYRREEPFMRIDCSSIPENLLESELFGYEPGAFTGASKNGKIGLVELANKGTLFLDEIGEMPLELQAKLLTLIQDSTFYKVGGKEKVSVDMRIIAATNKNIEQMVRERRFRKDLFYRLNVVSIIIPPLRERKDDIIPMVEMFLQKFNKQYNINKNISASALKVLLEYNWPGNVRELANVLENLVILSEDNNITNEDLPNNIKKQIKNEYELIDTNIQNMSLKRILEEYEKHVLIRAKEKYCTTTKIGKILSVDSSTIRRKFKKYNIK